MIRPFESKDTERMWYEQYVERVDRAVQRVTVWRLKLIRAARDVEVLRNLPGNRPEHLVGNRLERGAEDVELVNYH